MRRKQPQTSAIVVPAAAPNAYAVIRSLTACGVSVIALDHRKTPLCCSRLCRFEVVPDPDGDAAGFVGALAGIAKSLPGRPVLFATEDLHVTVVHRHRPQLEPHVRYPFTDYRCVLDCVDKRGGLARARDAGLTVPQTFSPETPEDLSGILPRLDRFPYVVKPAAKFEWDAGTPVRNEGFFRTYGTKALRVADPRQLTSVFADARRRGFTVLVQEEIEGPADRLVAIDFYADAGSRLLAHQTGRKLRQRPVDFGTCTLGCTCEVPRLVPLARDYVRALGFRGIGNLEFKEREGRFYLMEINPRPWMWLQMATASGVNLPLIAHRDLAGIDGGPATPSNGRRRWVDLRTDSLHLLAGPGRGAGGRLGFGAWLRSLQPLPVEARATLADPLPPIYAVLSAAARRLRRAPGGGS